LLPAAPLEESGRDGDQSWNIPESIDRLTLRASGEPLMVDRNVATNGRVLLDTVCDKLDMTAGAN
jgi:hypothetical protein